MQMPLRETAMGCQIHFNHFDRCSTPHLGQSLIDGVTRVH